MTKLSSVDRRKQQGTVGRYSTEFKFRVVLGCFLTLISMCCVSVLTIISRQQQQQQHHGSDPKEAISWQYSFVVSSAASSLSSESDSSMHDSSHETTKNDRRPLTKTTMMIDILSIGSVMRPELQQAQRETFASHESIRHFFAVTEHNDTSEPSCHVDLKTMAQDATALCQLELAGKKVQSAGMALRSKATHGWFSSNHVLLSTAAGTRTIAGLFDHHG
jgi:hypothetical protein